MSLEFRLYRQSDWKRGLEPIGDFRIASPWQDIPILSALLAHRLRQPYDRIDWNTAPGSREGAEIYRRFARLLSRFDDLDFVPSSGIDLLIDRQLELISYDQIETAIGPDDVVAALEAFVASTAGVEERQDLELLTARGLLALARSMSEDRVIQKIVTVTRRTHDGPINYWTAGLEGFDKVTEVSGAAEGTAVRCSFVSGYCYEIPLEHMLAWTELVLPSGRIKAIEILEDGEGFRIETSSQQVVDVHTSMLLRHCEPDYVDASPRSEVDIQRLQDAIARFGAFRKIC